MHNRRHANKTKGQDQKSLLQWDVNPPLRKEGLSWSKGCNLPQPRSICKCFLKASSAKAAKGTHNPALKPQGQTEYKRSKPSVVTNTGLFYWRLIFREFSYLNAPRHTVFISCSQFMSGACLGLIVTSWHKSLRQITELKSCANITTSTLGDKSFELKC